LQLGGFEQGSKLLDVGCANGPYSIELACRGFHMVGLDIAANNISIAKQHSQALGLNNIEFIQGDAESIQEISDDEFDGVISFSCIRYMDNPIAALKEMYRIVKPGGVVVVDFPNKASPWFYAIKTLVKRGKIHPHDHHYFTYEALNMFDIAGFVDLTFARILYIHKLLPSILLSPALIFEMVGELPLLNNLATIIMVKGVKPIYTASEMDHHDCLTCRGGI